jgi:hypothetical protein
MNTSTYTPSQPTDLLHRRVPLNLRAAYLWQSVPVRIVTNSRAILQAAAAAGLTPIQETHARSRFCWEVTVEEDSAAPGPACTAQVWRNDQSVFIEIAQRQWFAFDAKSGDGAGFLAAQAPELAAHEYIEAILRSLLSPFTDYTCAAGCDD